MKNTKSAIAIMLIASLVVPTAHAKKKHAPAALPVTASSQASASSQAGGLPATNERVAALEAAVVTLRADLTSEVAARMAADTRLANAILDEAAARRAADAALAAQIAANQSTVFVAEGSADNISGGTVTVATKTLPAGTYFMLAAVQMVNAQSSGDANARCMMSANGTLLADTSDLQFPLLTTGGGGTSGAFGSTMFAPLQGTYASSTPITVDVQCSESNGKNGGLNAFVQIAALKVVNAQ